MIPDRNPPPEFVVTQAHSLVLLDSGSRSRIGWGGPLLLLEDALRRRGAEVARLEIDLDAGAGTRLRRNLEGRMSIRALPEELEPATLKGAAQKALRAVGARGGATVITDLGPLAARLAGKTRVALWTEAPLAASIRREPRFHGIPLERLDPIVAEDLAGIGRADHLLFASERARDEAREAGAPDRGDAAILPYPSPLDLGVDEEAMREIVGERFWKDVLRVLWFGEDWERDRGPVALALVEGVLATNSPAELVVLGCPPRNLPSALRPNVRHCGPADLSAAAGRSSLERALFDAHLLLHLSPTPTSGAPMALAAAAALPAACLDLGGSPTRAGRTAMVVSPNLQPGRLLADLRALLGDPERHRDMSLAAFRHYRQHLSADAVAERLLAHLDAPKPGLIAPRPDR